MITQRGCGVNGETERNLRALNSTAWPPAGFAAGVREAGALAGSRSVDARPRLREGVQDFRRCRGHAGTQPASIRDRPVPRIQQFQMSGRDKRMRAGGSGVLVFGARTCACASLAANGSPARPQRASEAESGLPGSRWAAQGRGSPWRWARRRFTDPYPFRPRSHWELPVPGSPPQRPVDLLVAVVAHGRHAPLVHRAAHRTSGLSGVRAVGEATLGREGGDLRVEAL